MFGTVGVMNQNVMVFYVLFWCVLFQVKHFFADYIFQGRYMMGKFKGGIGWILPLTAHCLVHAFMTLVIAVTFFGLHKWWVAVVDFVLHFIMDRIKASPKMLGRFKTLSATEYVALIHRQHELKHAITHAHDLPGMANELEEIDKKFEHNKYFWWSLGLDQGVHHISHYLVIWYLLNG